MSSDNNSNGATGVTVPTLLTIIFLVLKLAGVITWSWLWVLSPWPIALACVGLILCALGLLKLAADAADRRKWRKTAAQYPQTTKTVRDYLDRKL